MKRLVQIIILIAMIPFAIYFWPESLGGDTTFMLVQGHSMLPTILPGSIVVAKTSPEYNVGDIIAYTQRDGSASKIIVHRILETDHNDHLVIKGDNNPAPDAGFPKDKDILGTVLFSTPYVGDIISLFKNPIVMILAAGILFFIQIQQKKRKEKKEMLRCYRLGIAYIPPKMRNSLKKRKKHDYSMFYAAIFLNILTFALIQVLISNDIAPEGDFLTGFMYNAIVPSLASTLIFAFYFIVIFVLYFFAKSSERKSERRKILYNSTGSQELFRKKKSGSMMSIVSTCWVLYCMMAIFQIMTLAGKLSPLVN